MYKIMMIGLPRSEFSRKKCIYEAVEEKIKLYIVEKKNIINEFKKEVELSDEQYIEFIESDTENVEKLVEIVNEELIDNIISLSEFQLETAAIIRDKTNKKGNSVQVEHNIRDKAITREILVNAGLSNIVFGVSKVDELLDIYTRLNIKKCIVKPLSLAGSVGVRSIECYEDLVFYLQEIKHHDMLKKETMFLIEEYIEGEEFSIEGVVINGKFIIFGITKKHTTSDPYFMECGHEFPAINLPINKNEFDEFIQSCIESMDIVDGAIHAEVKVNNKKIELIEIHTRYGGDNITCLIENATSLRIYSILYSIYLNNFNITNIDTKVVSYCGIKYILSKNGYIKNLNCKINKKLGDIDIIKCGFNYKNGDYVNCYPHSIARIGNVIWKSSEYIDYDIISRRIDQKLSVIMESKQYE